jgi:putative PEP-CTERM system TPR-repeat lipoprotein
VTGGGKLAGWIQTAIHIEDREQQREARRRRLLQTLAAGLGLVCAAAGVYVLLPEPEAQEYLEKSLELRHEGRLDAAIETLKKGLVRAPEDVELRRMLATVYLENEDGTNAAAQFMRLEEFGRKGTEITFQIARALLLAERFEEVLARLAFVSSPPGDPTALLLRGRARLGLDRPENARKAFASALRVSPENVEAQIGLASASLALGEVEEALRAVDIAIEQDRNSYLGWLVKGDAMMARRDPLEAQQAYDRAIELRPGLPAARLGLAHALIAQGKTDEARGHLADIIERDPRHPGAHFLEAQAALHDSESRRDSRLRSSDLESAQLALTLAMRGAPDHPSSHLLLGWIFLTKGQPEQARAHLLKYIAREPGEPIGTRLLADVYLRQGEIREAIDVLEPAAAHPSAGADLLANLGNAYLRIGEFDQATRFLERAARLAPDAPGIRTQIAVNQVVRGEFDEGMRELEAIVSVNPGYLPAELLLTIAQYRRGDYDKALASATRLAEQRDGDPLALNLMAAVYEARGDVARAGELYLQGLSLDPKNVSAMYNLARLSLQDGAIEVARERFNAILVVQPGNLLALLALSQISEGQNEVDDALAILERARAANPGALAPRLELVRLHLQAKRTGDALVVAEEARRLEPANVAALQALGRAQLRAGQARAAQATLRRVVAQRPGSAAAHYEYAHARIGANDLVGGRESLQRALAIDPNHVNAKAALGALSLRKGELDEAREIAAEIQHRWPDTADGYALEGDVLMTAQRPRDAAVAYETALERRRTRPLILKLHDAYVQAGAVKKAQAFLRDWLAANAQDVEVRVTLARSLVEAGNPSAAKAEFERAVEYRPDDALLLNNLAWLRHQTGDAGAIELARRAHELRPNHPDVLDTYGWILAQNNEATRGVELLQAAVDEAPDNPQIRYHLAATFARLGLNRQARKQVEVLLASDQTTVEPALLEGILNNLE